MAGSLSESSASARKPWRLPTAAQSSCCSTYVDALMYSAVKDVSALSGVSGVPNDHTLCARRWRRLPASGANIARSEAQSKAATLDTEQQRQHACTQPSFCACRTRNRSNSGHLDACLVSSLRQESVYEACAQHITRYADVCSEVHMMRPQSLEQARRCSMEVAPGQLRHNHGDPEVVVRGPALPAMQVHQVQPGER
jgi:hypothetical protein